jgi:hypothetical protein
MLRGWKIRKDITKEEEWVDKAGFIILFLKNSLEKIMVFQKVQLN